MLLSLLTTRIKLGADRADTQSKIAALYVPQLSDQPLKQQVAAKQASDNAEQSAQARLTRQNNWDVALTVGAHQQLNPVGNSPEPYGEVSVTYNLGSHAIDKHLDRELDAYAGWKKVQESDVERSMIVLRDEVEQTIAAQKNRIDSLQLETGEIEKNLKLVNDAKTRVRETDVEGYKAMLARGEKPVLVDVREDHEFSAGHVKGAVHMSKGTIERDVEAKYPDKDTPLVLYCGGGFRSALAADNLQKMGYTNPISLDGGWRALRESGLRLETGENS